MYAGRSADSDVRARGCVCVCEVGGLVGCVVHHVDHPGDGRPVIGLSLSLERPPSGRCPSRVPSTQVDGSRRRVHTRMCPWPIVPVRPASGVSLVDGAVSR